VVDRTGDTAALIGRLDRRGTLLWSLPKGHIEPGETAAQTAEREVREETGIHGTVLRELGTIDYWFVVENRRVHKTVHHFLMTAVGGELSDEDIEVTEVAWVPLADLERRLAYADERRLARRAMRLLRAEQVNGTRENAAENAAAAAENAIAAKNAAEKNVDGAEHA
jgi:8-oxo-dGTP pyrophosphatase MutT (NUDIX family)